jgi:hypothetical protein
LNFLAAFFLGDRLFHCHEFPGCFVALGSGGHPAEPCLQLGALLDRALAGIVADQLVTPSSSHLKIAYWRAPGTKQRSSSSRIAARKG